MLRNKKQANVETAIQYTHENVVTERHYLSELAQNDTLKNDRTLAEFQDTTGLNDLFWQALYFRFPGYEYTLDDAIAEVDGYVIFLHGWTGSHRIWENLPMKLTAKHKNIVCFNLDINGFDQSGFLDPNPSVEQCSPAAIMQSIEYWLEAVGLWPAHKKRNKKPFYLFVGHSMGGAALFYKDISNWKRESYGFYALAPAIFFNDAQRKTFFKTVGVSIGLPSLSAVKDALAPRVIEMLGPGASPEVKTEHLRVYNQTAFGTLAQTIYALGTTTTPPERNDWHRFTVGLGHKDKIVRLDNLLNVLERFAFHPKQIRLALGDHYFFSHGDGSPTTHHHNQRAILDDLLQNCYQLTREITRSQGKFR